MLIYFRISFEWIITTFLFWVIALKTVIGSFKLLLSDWLKNSIQNNKSVFCCTNYSTLKISDEWCMYIYLIFWWEKLMYVFVYTLTGTMTLNYLFSFFSYWQSTLYLSKLIRKWLNYCFILFSFDYTLYLVKQWSI